MVVLDESEVDARLLIPIPAVRLKENAALVSMDDGLDPEHPGEWSFTHSDHRGHASILIILLDMLRYTLRI
jgi:hypothetical protein